MPGMSEPPRWLSSGEAAARMGIVPRTLYRLIDREGLPAYQIGRVIRLMEHEVDAFVERCRVEPGTLGHLHPPAASSGERSD